ncbi:MAG: metallophosphoesterase [Proteobacteria bacterium]|nr:metallophosphoesterase [Pseudomonadota bacterium]
MGQETTRREFAKLAGLGGAVFASGLGFSAVPANAATQDFHFVQLSDTHWGFEGKAVNPEAETTLPRAIAAVNALAQQPDFVVFTGDLTHNTDDAQLRRRRMAEFRAHASRLTAREIRFMPGEHDAAADRGEAYREMFGPTNYTFDHKGIHFIALDNVSDPAAALGPAQLDWLAADLGKQPKSQPIVVLAHRPLFDLYPDWDWTTADGAKAIDMLMGHSNVAVFYGHIHQEHHHMTGHIAHHAAMSLIFPQPAPGSQPKRTPPVMWDAKAPYKGLGFRSFEAKRGEAAVKFAEQPLKAT